MSENIREIVLDTLIANETENKKSHLLIRDVLDKYDYLDSRDKAFFKRLCEGTILYRITLDYVLNKLSQKPMEKCKPVVRNILRMSAYQILFMDKVPDSAACDEAVKLVKKKHYEQFGSFVNGVLRNLVKSKESALDFEDIEDKELRLSVKYSMPLWIVKMFVKEQKDPEALLKGLTRIRPTCIKIVDGSCKEEILRELKESGIEYKESRYVENAYLLDNFEGVTAIKGFLEGKIIIQDESSMMASVALGIKPGEKAVLIDVCAAPGGKSCYAASLLSKDSTVISRDVSEKKIELINENKERLKLSNITTEVFDACELDETYVGKADYVICDVPCSGLGIMSRKSDIRYNISNESMKEICDLQKIIAVNAAKYLKKGGIMIYSTCTIHRSENEKMVKYIENNTSLKGDSLKPFLPKVFENEKECEYAVSLLPNVEETDGFFIARFVNP